jgi:endonuclease-8
VPEGDTVYHTAQLLDRALSGQVLERSDFRVPQHAAADLSGGTVVETVSRGKHLLTRVDRDSPTGTERWTLHTHLKMEGSWKVLKPGQRWPRPAHTARVVLETPRATAVGFSLGVVELLDRSAEGDAVGHLGPDLLGPDWDEEVAVANLLRDPERPLREALLDQRNLAGIGNLYAAELCFIAGVHPQSPVRSVPDLSRLTRRAHQMLELNKGRWVQTTTGDLRERERTWVYRRDRSPCRRCGTPVVVEMQGPAGRDRASYWCPSCQPLR